MYRYSEDGRSYILIDGRNDEIPRFRKQEFVHSLCVMCGDDGVVIVDRSDNADYRMEFVPRDREAAGAGLDGACLCSVAFADLLGIKPFHSRTYRLECAGTVIDAEILSHLGECKEVRLVQSGIAGAPICQGEFE